MRFYSTAERESMGKRIEELKEMEKSNYQNMSQNKELARRVEFYFLKSMQETLNVEIK